MFIEDIFAIDFVMIYTLVVLEIFKSRSQIDTF